MTEATIWQRLSPTHREALVNYAAFQEETFPHTQVIDDLLGLGLVTVLPAETVCGQPMARMKLTGNGERLVEWAEMLRKHR